MIEQLESRTLFSLTPAHAALNVLRGDVASIGHKIYAMIAANKAAIANLNHDVSLFPATALADNNSLRELNFQFNSQLATLITDYDNIKVLLGQDITQLINTSNAYNRQPGGSVGLAVQDSQQLLTAQGIASSTTLSQDCTGMENAYLQALAPVAASHPLDATLVTRTSHIAAAFAANVLTIQVIANTIVTTDIPNFITTLEPEGIINAARVASVQGREN
jgi:hypothetical protein